MFFGPAGEITEKYKAMPDMSARELLTLAPMLVLVFWMGLLPNHFLKFSEKSMQHLVDNKSNYNLTISTEVDSAAKTAGVNNGL